MFSCIPCKMAQRSLLAGLGILFLALAIGSAFLLQNYHESLMRERQEKTRKMVETAYNLMVYYNDKAEKGEMNSDKARHYAIETIKQATMDPNGYFWIINTYPKGVMHPVQPKWENLDLSNQTDPTGKKIFVEMVKLMREKGEGFYDYFWEKPYTNENKLYEKVSFIKLYKPWDWIVGTGVYIDDINTAFWNAVLVACGLTIAVLMFVMALAMTVSENFKRPSP